MYYSLKLKKELAGLLFSRRNSITPKNAIIYNTVYTRHLDNSKFSIFQTNEIPLRITIKY